MYYMLCCDISTLRCTSSELETKIADFSTKYHKLSDNLWLYCAPKEKCAEDLISPDEYLITKILGDFILPDSIVFSFEIPQRNCYWELPQDAVAFLASDEPGDG